jgi:hypothetical protein
MAAVGVLDSFVDAGFDDFEINIPYHEQRPYKIFLWHAPECWMASMEDNLNKGREVAAGEGATVGEALWNLTDQHLHGAKPWTGDATALPERIMLVAAIVWADAVREAAEEDAAKVAAAAAVAGETEAAYAQAVKARDTLLDRSLASW